MLIMKMKNELNMPDFEFEKEIFKLGKIVAGIDEAGRGALAGPVVAAAVILKSDFINTDFGVNDSKKLSAKKRDTLYDVVFNNAISVGIGIIDNYRIDEINILQATQEAMHQAINNLTPKPDFLLIDGNYFKNNGIPYKTVIKGDSKSLSIAAASIIAKVTRDRWMIENADVNYPDYLFSKHKGYGTKKHYEAIKENGITPIHRKTFLKKILLKEQSLF